MSAFFAQILNYFYELSGNYGLSIIVFTVIFRIVMLPLAISQRKNMVKTKQLQPLVDEINKKYKHDSQKRSQMTMQLYKEHNHNPFGGCLPVLIQLPIIYSLFSVFRDAKLYLPASALQEKFLWLPSMSVPDTLSNILPSIEIAQKLPGILPIIAAIFTYLTFQRSQKMQPTTENGPNLGFMGKIFPFMILYFGATYAAGLILYWAVSNILQYVQDIVLQRVVDGGVK